MGSGERRCPPHPDQFNMFSAGGLVAPDGGDPLTPASVGKLARSEPMRASMLARQIPRRIGLIGVTVRGAWTPDH